MAWRRIKETDPWARAPLSLALEPRIMFDAAGAATYADATESEPLPPPPEPQEAPPAAEIAFIDTGVEGWEQIRDAIRADVEVVLIAPHEDGAARAAEALAGRSGIGAVHIFSHGFGGGLTLGSASIDATNAHAFAQSFGAIGAALAPGGDILVYGCSTASDGGELIRLIAGFSDADVAASIDATGAAALGGDWVLELSTGGIEAQSPFSAGTVEPFAALLAAPPDQNFDGETERFLNAAGETVNGVTYTLVSPPGGQVGITQVPSSISITPNASDRAVMFNYTGGAAQPGPFEARFASASGDEFRMVSMEIDTGAGLGTSTNLTISGYRDGALIVSDTVDTSVSDAAGSITYAKNGITAGRGGTLTFGAQWGFIDEIRITGTNTIVVLDDLNFDAAVPPNAAPVVDLNGAAGGADVSRAFTEGGSPVAIAPDALVTDADAGDSITSMTVTLTNAQAGDSLNLSGTYGTIGAGQISGSGGTTITITGAHSRADIQAALRAITFGNSSDDPSTVARTITVVVNDGTANSATRTATMTVTGVNDAPTLTATGASPTFTEGGAATPLFTGAAISTVEAGQTVSALTFTVANLADGAAERIVVAGTEFQLVDGAGGALTGGGTASISVAGGVATVSLSGLARSAAAAQTLVESIAYRHAGDNPAVATARVATLTSVTDSGGTANGGQDTRSLSIASTVTLVAVNDAPTLGATTFSLTGTNEDGASGATSVAAIAAGLTFADLDGPATGVAVVGLSGAGQWQASTDGTNWTAIGPVSASSARLLDGSTLIRYVPDGANGETATLTVRGWDGSSGASGALADATANGGTTAFSAQTATVGLVVTSVNDAPTVTAAANYAFAATNEDAPGAAVAAATILAGVGYADVDAGALAGLALTGASGPGVWRYSTDGGTTWLDVGAVDGDAALLLRGTDQLRFFPNGDAGGTGTLSFRAWDQTSGAAGTKVAIGATGGDSAFSAQVAGATIAVAAVNDAPTLGQTSFGLSGVDEGSTSGATSVGAILTGLGFADVDGPASGLAIVGLTGLGTWEYSLDGTTWLTLAPVSAANARLLDPTASIRYAAGGAVGETASLTVRGWDGSSGTNGGLADAGTNGAATPFSAATATVSIAVAGINDAPTVTAPAGLAVVEDAPFALTGISFADVDAGSASVTATFSADRGSLSGVSSGGVSVAGSGTGVVTLTGSIANINAFLAGGSLFYVTAANDTASATLTVTIDDGGNAGAGGALQATASVPISVTPVNDAPVIGGVGGESSGVVSGAGPQAVALFADATVVDSDSAAFAGGRLSIAQTSGTANGSFGLGAGAASGGNAVFAEGEAVSVGGVVIGAVAAGRDGQNGAILEIALNADATAERVQNLLRALTYDAPSGLGDRGFTLTIDDGGANGGPNNDQSTASASFTIAATPNPPVVSGLGGDSLVYREGDGLARIDAGQNAAVSDADSTNFAGGELRAAITAGGAAAEDRLSFAQSVGEVEIDGANLRVGGVVVGTLSGGTGGADLVVALNADATPARVTTLLRALAYENLDANAPTETTRTISVTIRDSAAGPGAATSLASLVTVAVERVNDAPTLTGINPAAQAISDAQTVSPFAAAVVADPDGAGVALTVTVTIDDAAKGSFTTLAGFAHQGGGVYVFTGTQADAQAALRALVFTPAQNRVAPGLTETTSFTVVVDDGTASANATAQVQTTSANDAPALGGLVLGQTTTDAGTVTPFSAATIADPDPGQTIAVSVTIDDAAKGAFTAASLAASGFTDQGGGVYSRTASDAATAQAALRALVFAPTADRLAVGSSETTTFSVSVSDGVAAAATGTASVVTTSVNDAPVIGGVPAQQQIGQDASVSPFAAAVVTDPDTGQPANVSLTIDGAAAGAFTPASLAASGFVAQGGGVYVFNGADAAQAQAALRALVFQPAAGRLAAGASDVVRFSIAVSDGLQTGSATQTLTISGPAPEPAPAFVPAPSANAFGGGGDGGPGVGPADDPPPGRLFAPTPPAAPPAPSFGAGLIGSGLFTPQGPGEPVRSGPGEPGFFVAAAAAGTPPGFGVLAQTAIAPVAITGDRAFSFVLPAATFVVESVGVRPSIEARLADGSPLPQWIRFDPERGAFEIEPPPGFTGALEIAILASLPDGRSAVSSFVLTVEAGGADAPEAGGQEDGGQEDGGEQDGGEQGGGEDETQTPQQNGGLQPAGPVQEAAVAGKPALTEALKAASRGAMATQAERMANLLIADLRVNDPSKQPQEAVPDFERIG